MIWKARLLPIRTRNQSPTTSKPIQTSNAKLQLSFSHFLELPRKVRNLIYRNALIDTLVSNDFHRLFAQRGAYATVENDGDTPKGSLAILWVNKQVNEEATVELTLVVDQVFGIEMEESGNLYWEEQGPAVRTGLWGCQWKGADVYDEGVLWWLSIPK